MSTEPRQPQPSRGTLSRRLVVLTASLVLVTSSILGLYVSRDVREKGRAEMLERGLTYAATIAQSSEYGIYTENRAALRPLVEGIGADPTVAYVTIRSRDRRILVARTRSPEIRIPDMGEGAEGTPRILPSPHGRESYIDLSVPVMSPVAGSAEGLVLDAPARSTVLGYVQLGLSDALLVRRVRSFVVSTGLLTCTLVGLAIVLSSLLTRRIVHPIEQLQLASFDLARGNFERRIDISSDGEVGDLARAFDLMRQRLRDARSVLEERAQELARELAHGAFHDALTGLPNRVLLRDRLADAVARAERRHGQFAIVFLDLDRFKLINDSLGHAVGDKLLVEVGRRIRSCVRESDTVARFGGDEFVVLVEDVRHDADVELIALKIREQVMLPLVLDGYEVFTSASCGIAMSRAGHSPEQVLSDADTAMYRAKAHGNGIEVFDVEMHENTLDRLRLENDLRRAVEKDQLFLVYQPIVTLPGGRIAGCEALLRWRHPERGVIAPREFIGMAEETGVIVQLGKWVLAQVCDRLREWQRLPGADRLWISANLSWRQLSHPHFAELLGGLLATRCIEPARLCLEVTESTLFDEPEPVLREVLETGVGLFLDDFGTGYSSLSCLHRLPIDKVKIDRSFIADILHHSRNREITRTIIQLAHHLDMEVVAEGVESAEQEELLATMSCDYVQGFWRYRPMPVELLEELLGLPGESLVQAGL